MRHNGAQKHLKYKSSKARKNIGHEERVTSGMRAREIHAARELRAHNLAGPKMVIISHLKNDKYW